MRDQYVLEVLRREALLAPLNNRNWDLRAAGYLSNDLSAGAPAPVDFTKPHSLTVYLTDIDLPVTTKE